MSLFYPSDNVYFYRTMNPGFDPWNAAARKRFWAIFFPEGLGLERNTAQAIASIRKKRTVRLLKPNPLPITEPAREILFTANLLITLPDFPARKDALPLPPTLLKKARSLGRKPQAWFFDHPIPLNAPAKHHEAILGLTALDAAIAFEKKQGVVRPEDKVSLLLSLSATHAGLDKAAAPFLRQLLETRLRLKHLTVYLVTETDARKMITQCMAKSSAERNRLSRIFGVSGEYGRHYTFLKAVAAFWQVLVDDTIKAVFKMDLDQVFPQKELLHVTGKTAFAHFKTPLWGALAKDNNNDTVELGMLAGALVDKKDIHHAPFKPDVEIPATIPPGPASFFYSLLTRAVSTHAEMGPGRSDTASQRFHILGGMNGILVRSLRRYRPFTPTFISRAEDQAYLMARLYDGKAPYLRALHAPGFVMRHDKDVVAAQAVAAAETGRDISELLRVLQFTYYAQALPWSVKKTKACLDPFTGCFISPLPWTLTLFRYAFHPSKGRNDAFRTQGAERLLRAPGARAIRSHYQFEKRAWDEFYNRLDSLEKGLRHKNKSAIRVKRNADKIINHCKLNIRSE